MNIYKIVFLSFLFLNCDLTENVQADMDICRAINPDWKKNKEDAPVSPNGMYDKYTHEEGEPCRINSECVTEMCLCWTCVELPPIDIVIYLPPGTNSDSK